MNNQNNSNKTSPNPPNSKLPRQMPQYPKGVQKNPGNTNNSNTNNPNPNNMSRNNTVKNANMADEFQVERTQIFDSMSNEKSINTLGSMNNINNINSRNEDDGSYHYTGKNIQSSRQKFANSSGEMQRAGKSRKSNGYDENMSVSNKSKSRRKNRDNIAEPKSEGFIMSGIVKAILYIAGVILVSVVMAYNIISIANDVFAFAKESVSTEVVIPENATIKDIADILYENKLIKYPGIFDFYSNYRKKDKIWEFEAGTYPVTSTMNYDDLLYEFRKKAGAPEIITITVPEGYTIDQIIDLFIKNGMGTREKFVEAVNAKYDQYKFTKLLNNAEFSPDRKYRLEGYIFPDTYEFYTTESETSIITKFLNNFDSKFNEDFYKRCDTLGMTVDEIVTLASIVEREAKLPGDYTKISAVFHNRLLNSASFPYLQSDATIQYSLDSHNPELTQADLRVDLPYNTYTREGLPPSAICNPGYEAIYDALFPEENFSDYYFFVANTTTGEVYYGRTSAEHEANKILAKSGE